eukprot:865893-Prymnesium_polylepis.1
MLMHFHTRRGARHRRPQAGKRQRPVCEAVSCGAMTMAAALFFSLSWTTPLRPESTRPIGDTHVHPPRSPSRLRGASASATCPLMLAQWTWRAWLSPCLAPSSTCGSHPGGVHRRTSTVVTVVNEARLARAARAHGVPGGGGAAAARAANKEATARLRNTV